MKSSSAFWWLHSRLWKGFGFISKPFSGAQPGSGVKGHEAGGNVLAGDVSAIWTCVADCFLIVPNPSTSIPGALHPLGSPRDIHVSARPIAILTGCKLRGAGEPTRSFSFPWVHPTV